MLLQKWVGITFLPDSMTQGLILYYCLDLCVSGLWDGTAYVENPYFKCFISKFNVPYTEVSVFFIKAPVSGQSGKKMLIKFFLSTLIYCPGEKP